MATATPPTPPRSQRSDARHHASALRNRGPVSQEIARTWARLSLPSTPERSWLEVGSGTGALAMAMTDALPHVQIQPTELTTRVASERSFAATGKFTKPDEDELDVINTVTRECGLEDRVRPAVHLDLTEPVSEWRLPLSQYDAIHANNVLHIAPAPTAMRNLVTGASVFLRPGGFLSVYGAFKVNGAFTSPSNEEFDAWLRGNNPSFGLRDVSDLVSCGAAVGLVHDATVDMPANNFFVVLRKPSSSTSTSNI